MKFECPMIKFVVNWKSHSGYYRHADKFMTGILHNSSV